MWGDGGAYAAWTTYLSRWQADLSTPAGDLPRLAPEDFQPQTWVRLTNHVIDALNGRLRAWTTALSADVAAAGSEFAVGRALGQSRHGLRSILALADHPSLPEELRGKLRELVAGQIRAAQEGLEAAVERSARAGTDRAAVEARRRTVRDNPLTAVLDAPPPAGPPGIPAPAADPWALDPAARPRRRLALD